MMISADVYQIINSPIVVALVSAFLTTTVVMAGAVVGLFIKVSAISQMVKDVSDRITDISNDKDVMRWSQWGPSHSSHEVERRTGSNT